VLQLQQEVRLATPPEALLSGIMSTFSGYYGLESLALASLVEAPR